MRKRQLELAEKVADVGQEDFTPTRTAMSHKAQKMKIQFWEQRLWPANGLGSEYPFGSSQRAAEEVQVWCGKQGFLSSTFLSCQQMAQMR